MKLNYVFDFDYQDLPYSGVQRNFFPTSLPSGWSICHVSTYDRNLSSSNLPSILSSCYKSKLLLGCRTTGTTMLTVAAMGDRSDVLYNCGSTTNCRNVANGVGWYYSTIYSWGFANGSDSVNRNPCDLSGTNPNYRLCWLTNGGGGYRCGSTTGLTSSTSYEKVIYHSA